MLILLLKPKGEAVTPAEEHEGSLNRRLTMPRRDGVHYLITPDSVMLNLAVGITQAVFAKRTRCYISAGFKSVVLGHVEHAAEFNEDEKLMLEAAILALFEDLDDE